MKEDSASEYKSQTGWSNATDSTANGGFEFVPQEEQESGPGLVLTERDSLQRVVRVADTAAIRHSVAEKLKDFYGYVEILGNKKFDPEMRSEALKIMLEMIDDTATNTIRDTDLKSVTKISRVLSDIKENRIAGDSMRMQVEDIQVHITQVSGDSLCKGYILCTRTYFGKPVEVSRDRTEFVIRKVSKKFGSTEQKVNAVFLGNTLVTARK
jgi:hypothetical protein